MDRIPLSSGGCDRQRAAIGGSWPTTAHWTGKFRPKGDIRSRAKRKLNVEGCRHTAALSMARRPVARSIDESTCCASESWTPQEHESPLYHPHKLVPLRRTLQWRVRCPRAQMNCATLSDLSMSFLGRACALRGES